MSKPTQYEQMIEFVENMTREEWIQLKAEADAMFGPDAEALFNPQLKHSPQPSTGRGD